MSSNYNLQSGNVSIAVGGKYTLDDGSVLKVSGWALVGDIIKHCKQKGCVL